ncbi:PBSX family phage terminase large subunit [Rhodococcoides fascians]|uniref:PBSX family phage terminase large subunit n=1 Tax=Rhodococcoides fascians TaxID=1828 RepID=UPI00050C506C|nr:PBSX family phage terminase large subunit [Rhodococcus fascians]
MSKKQILSYAGASGRVNIFEGSIRAGKTFSWLMLMMKRIRDSGTEGAIIIVGKNRDAIYRNVFEPLESIPAFRVFENAVSYRQGAATAKIFGKTVHVIGANDAKSENKIRGMTIQLAFCDEVTVLDVSFFKQLLGRMSIEGAQLFGTTNPDSPMHWLKVDYLDRMGVPDKDGEIQLADWRRFHFTIDDNPSLSESYKKSIKGEYTGLWYRRFILGHWVSADGAVYDMWDPDEHIVKWAELPQMQELFGVGIDYGTTNATTALLLGVGMDGILYLIDEWRHQSSSAEARWTDAQLSAGIREWLPQKHHPSQDLAVGPLVVDPAAASFRVQLKQDGQHSHPAENDVLYGIRLFASLLAVGKLRVSDRCRGLITEIVGYSWDSKATENGHDAPVKVNDHSLDGARYIVATTEKRWRRYIELATPQKNAA